MCGVLQAAGAPTISISTEDLHAAFGSGRPSMALAERRRLAALCALLACFPSLGLFAVLECSVPVLLMAAHSQSACRYDRFRGGRAPQARTGQLSPGSKSTLA